MRCESERGDRGGGSLRVCVYMCVCLCDGNVRAEAASGGPLSN